MSTVSSATMNVAYVNAFIEAIKNVFETMAGLKPHVDKAFVKLDHTTMHDVSGVIGLSGPVVGSVVLTFSKRAARQAVTAFAGQDFESIDGDFQDAVGELVNMVAGSAKSKFPKGGVMISLPTVVVGAGHKISAPRNLPTLVIPCQLPDGPFALEVSYKELESSAAPE